jgi:NitT/TauT family transport system substrate-binding protein
MAALGAWPGLSSALSVPTQAAGLQGVTLAVARRRAMQHLPLTLAIELGFFAAEGLAVDVVDVDSEFRAVQAVVKGGASVAACAYSQTIVQQARGTALKAFVLSMRAPQVVLGVSPRTMAHFRDSADLRGRRVGMLMPADGGTMVVSLLLQRSGLKPTDVQLTASDDAGDVLARFRKGQLDAICVPDPLMTALEQHGEVKVVADSRSLSGTRDIFGGPMPGLGLCAQPDFLRQNSAICQALTNGLVRALKWLQTAGPSDFIKVLPDSHFESDRAVYLAALDRLRETFSVDGLITPDAMSTTLRVIEALDKDLRPERINLASTATNEYAMRAKSRFRA